MADYKNILIYGEMDDGKISSITRELLSMAKKIAEGLSQSVEALVIGDITSAHAEEFFGMGVDQIYKVSHPSLDKFHPFLYTQAMVNACLEIRPFLFLIGHTDVGSDVAPRMAARLNTIIFPNCTDIRIADGGKSIIYARPIYGGKAIGEFVSYIYPQIATVRPRSAPPAQVVRSKRGQIINLSVDIADSSPKVKMIEAAKEEGTEARLEEAKVIVCGGGGIGNAAGFQVLQELAELLHGAVGVTRVPCDERWMPLSLEIGQTGKIVSPNLYIAIGVSGAPQHIAGCLGSKYIVTINKERDAPIFRMSDFGVVGDYREILPVLIEEFKKLCHK